MTRSVITYHRTRPHPTLRIHRVPDGPPPVVLEYVELDWSTMPITDRARARAAGRAFVKMAEVIMRGFRQAGESVAAALEPLRRFDEFLPPAPDPDPAIGGAWLGRSAEFTIRRGD